MKSELNFKVIKDNQEYDMHKLDIWVSSFHVHSPNAELETIEIPGSDGAYLSESRMGVRDVDISLLVEADSLDELDDKKHLIYDLLYSREPFTIIRDFKKLELKVIQEGSYDIENITCSDGNFDITLKMLDPYLYGPKLSFIFPEDIFTIVNNGKADADPIFELTALRQSTFVLIQRQDVNLFDPPSGELIPITQRPLSDIDYQLIGTTPMKRSQKPYIKYETKLNSGGTNLIGWTKAAMGEVEGTIDGEIEATSEGFKAKSYGTGSDVHGPAIKTSLDEPVQDFRLFSEIDLGKSGAGLGEIYLLDVNGIQVARLGFTSPMVNSFIKYGESIVGNFIDNHYLVNEESKRIFNSRCYLRIEREGNTWRTYVDGMLSPYLYREEWVDRDKKYMNKVAQVVVRIAKFNDDEPADVTVNRVQLDRINERPTDEGIPYIVNPGDKIIFNHKTKDIFINGDPAADLKDFGGSYFKLKKGQNRIIISPRGHFDSKVVFQERFK